MISSSGFFTKVLCLLGAQFSALVIRSASAASEVVATNLVKQFIMSAGLQKYSAMMKLPVLSFANTDARSEKY
jgi:hypothetical protein